MSETKPGGTTPDECAHHMRVCAITDGGSFWSVTQNTVSYQSYAISKHMLHGQIRK